MPMAIPAIVAVAASYGTLAVTGWTLATLTIGQALALSAISSLASYAASSALGLNKPQSSPLGVIGQEGRLEQSRNPNAFHQYVFGTVKTSGVQRFAGTADSPSATNGYFYLIHAFCGAECRGMRGVYLNEKRASDSVFDSLTRFTPHLGSVTQTADADFVAEIPDQWTEADRGRGICYLATRLEWSQSAFASGLPQIFVLLDGITNIYDPRLGYTVFTRNWALCVAHYLTAPWGKNLAWSKLHEATLIASANICDERVRVAAKETTFLVTADVLQLPADARVLGWGDGVRVHYSGGLPSGLLPDTTYYVIPWTFEDQIKLAATVEDAYAGNAIAVGAGTGFLVYWDQARYTMDGMFTADTEPKDVLEQMKTAAAGHIFPRGGRWFIYAGAPAELPYQSFTEYDLAGSYQYSDKRSMRDSFNGVKASFFDPNNVWQPNEAVVLKPTQALIEEDGEERYVDRNYPFTTDVRRVQRLMKIEREINRQQETMTLPLNLSGMKVAPLDGVNISIADRFTDKSFRVVSWTLNPAGVIELQLQSTSGTEYDWTVEDEEEEEPPSQVDIPDASDILPPDYVTVNFTNLISPTSIWVTWPAVNNIFATGYDVEYRTPGVSTWTSYGVVDIAAERKVQIPRSPPQDIRIRTRTDTFISEWRESLAPETPTGLTQSGPGEIDWTPGARTAFLQMFKDGVFWNVNVEPLAGPFSGLNDGTYQLRALDAHGSMSAVSASVAVVGSSRVDLQACKLEYSIVSPK